MSIDEIVLDFSALKSIRPILTDEQRIVRDAPGNTMCVAVPGAGKTEVCIQRYERNEELNIRTLVLFFSRAAAEELKRRNSLAEAHTIHSYACQTVAWKRTYPDLLYRFICQPHIQEWDEVIVDEGQDLTPLQIDFINSIPKKSLFIVGDPYQSIYIGSWAKSYFDGAALGTKVFDIFSPLCARTEILGNRRSNQHIVDLLEGIYPRGMSSASVAQLDTIAIFARTHKELGQISQSLQQARVPHRLIERRGPYHKPRYKTFGLHPKLELMVLHQGKGRQFRTSIIYDWSSFTLEDINLLYVAVARASEQVFAVPNEGIAAHYLPSKLYKTHEEILTLVH